MPVIVWWLAGGALAFFGLNQAAGAVDKTGEGVRDLAIAAAIVAGGYLVFKKVK